MLEILCFGITKEITQSSVLSWEVGEPFSVEQLKEKLYEQFPSLKALNSLAIAVNGEYAENQQMIHQQDEIALIPPVSGG